MIRSNEQKKIKEITDGNPFISDDDLFIKVMDDVKYRQAYTDYQLKEIEEYVWELISNFRKPY